MHIAIISGSTRINRQSHRVALALEQYLQTDFRHTAEVLDLAAYAFPIMEEVLHRLPSPPEGLHDFADRVRGADALLFVSPEYNGSYTAALKNAIDYLKESEFAQKAIGTVSVTTGPLGGMRAAMNMQELILGVAGFPIPQMLLVGQVQQKFDEQGLLIDAAFEPKIKAFLDRFLWLAQAVVAKKAVLVG
jgi:NAD(P)H-dependent FMN reductase